MDQGYWLRRKRASVAMARQSTTAQARLVHFDLAGRYSVKAANCQVASGPPHSPKTGDRTIVSDNRVEITEAHLEMLIPRFYARVQKDALIGPVFDAAIGDWEHHLKKLVAFWSSVMLTSGRYKGNPVAAHLKHLPEITPPMFDRWLALWAEVTEEILPSAAAAALQNKAARIAESLKLALYFRLAPASGISTGPAAAVS